MSKLNSKGPCCNRCCSLASIPHWLQGNVGFPKAIPDIEGCVLP